MISQDQDIAQDKTKADLEIEKLRGEIWDLRYGWTKTLGTALITVLVAVGGWIYQANAERAKLEKDQQKTVTDRFYKARDAVSSLGEPTRRADAARDLGSLLRAPHTSSQFTDKEIITVLDERLLAEDNPDVLRVIATIIGGTGTLGLMLTCDENRVAAVRFAQASGEYIGARMDPNIRPSLKNANYIQFLARVPTIKELDDKLAHAVSAVEGPNEALAGRFEGSKIASGEYTWQLFRQAILTTPTAQPQESQATRLSDARHYAQAIAATSIALEGLLHQSGALPAKEDLSGITLFAVDLSGDSFEKVDLGKSYLSGQAADVRFKGADLSKATLDGFDVTKADFDNAILDGSFLPDLRPQVKSERVTFRGADWWNACMWVPETNRSDHPLWLQSFFPRTASSVRSFQCYASISKL